MYESMDMENKLICPNCGGNMEPSITDSNHVYVCRDCGCCIDSDELFNFDNEKTCPNCNQSIEGSECTYCGYDLGSDFE
jgi:hypothetical protein